MVPFSIIFVGEFCVTIYICIRSRTTFLMMLMDFLIRILDARSTSNLGINVGLKKGFRRKIYQLFNNVDWSITEAIF